MAKSINKIDLLLSCPGDVQNELEVVNKVVQKYNNEVGRAKDIFIDIRHWKKSSYPQSGAKPQEILNKQFVLDCDIAIAIFWTRFGTATDEFGSGTEEEITRLIEQNKQVFMYFSEVPINPSKLDIEQYKKISAFKEKYKDKGLYSAYENIDDFKEMLFRHICQYINDTSQNNEIKVQPSIIARNTKKFSILIDGFNLIKRLEAFKIDNDIICNQFSLENFGNTIKSYMVEKDLDCIEFICNECLLNENNNLIERFKSEDGVYVEELLNYKTDEKWTRKLIEYISEHSARFSDIVIVTTNIGVVDYLKSCRKSGVKIIGVDFNGDLPNLFRNQCYKILQLQDCYRDFFNYHYKYYNLKNMTIADYKNMLSNGDDRRDNQIRVEYSGEIYLSKDVGATNIHGLKFRWETYDAFNGYVGPMAASDRHYLQETFKELKHNWENDLKGYLDY